MLRRAEPGSTERSEKTVELTDAQEVQQPPT